MVRRWLGWAVVCAAIVMSSACGGGGDSPSAPAPAAGTVGPQGGLVTTSEGAEVVVPPKAFLSDVAVAISKDSTGAPPLAPGAQAAGCVYMITPHGGDSLKHAQVAIPIAITQIAAKEQLVLVTAQPGDTRWTVLSAATFSNGKLRAPVMHFSYFQPVLLVNTVVPKLAPAAKQATYKWQKGRRSPPHSTWVTGSTSSSLPSTTTTIGTQPRRRRPVTPVISTGRSTQTRLAQRRARQCCSPSLTTRRLR